MTAAKSLLHAAGRLTVPVLLLGAWQVFGAADMLPKYLSHPSAIGAALVELAHDGELAVHLRDTLLRLVAGFGIGCSAGVVAGLLAGISKPVRDFIEPLVAFIYPIPKIAFLPIVLVLFGLGSGSQVAIVSFSVFFPMFMATLHAVLHVDRYLVWVAQNFEAGRATILFRVVLPAALPEMFAGFRVSLALSFIVLFAAELIGAKTGLSRLVVEGEEWVRFDIMLSGIVCYAVLGFIADRLLLRVRRHVLRGTLTATGEAH